VIKIKVKHSITEKEKLFKMHSTHKHEMMTGSASG